MENSPNESEQGARCSLIVTVCPYIPASHLSRSLNILKSLSSNSVFDTIEIIPWSLGCSAPLNDLISIASRLINKSDTSIKHNVYLTIITNSFAFPGWADVKGLIVDPFSSGFTKNHTLASNSSLNVYTSTSSLLDSLQRLKPHLVLSSRNSYTQNHPSSDDQDTPISSYFNIVLPQWLFYINSYNNIPNSHFFSVSSDDYFSSMISTLVGLSNDATNEVCNIISNHGGQIRDLDSDNCMDVNYVVTALPQNAALDMLDNIHTEFLIELIFSKSWKKMPKFIHYSYILDCKKLETKLDHSEYEIKVSNKLRTEFYSHVQRKNHHNQTNKLSYKNNDDLKEVDILNKKESSDDIFDISIMGEIEANIKARQFTPRKRISRPRNEMMMSLRIRRKRLGVLTDSEESDVSEDEELTKNAIKLKLEKYLTGHYFYFAEDHAKANLRLVDRLIKKLEDAGATITKNYRLSQITCYVMERMNSTVYVHAEKNQKLCGNIEWVKCILRAQKMVYPRHSVLFYPIPLMPISDFSNIVVYIAAGYSTYSKEQLNNMVGNMGAKVINKFDLNKVTHIVSASLDMEDGINLIDLSNSCNIHLVNHLWLEDCYRYWSLQKESKPRYNHFPATCTKEFRNSFLMHDPEENPSLEKDTAIQNSDTITVISSRNPSSLSSSDYLTRLSTKVEIKSSLCASILDLNVGKTPISNELLLSKLNVLDKGGSLKRPPLKSSTISLLRKLNFTEIDKENLLHNSSSTISHGLNSDIRRQSKSIIKKPEVISKTSTVKRELDSSSMDNITSSSKRISSIINQPLEVEQSIEEARKSRKIMATPTVENVSYNPRETQYLNPSKKSNHVSGSEAMRIQSRVQTGKINTDIKSEESIETAGVKVLFTGMRPNESHIQVLLKSGIAIVDNPYDCTHLVAMSISRTEKFLLSVALGRWVVGIQWLEKSIESKKVLDPRLYIVSDEKMQTTYNFILARSLLKVLNMKTKLGTNYGILSNVIVWPQNQVHPGDSSLRNLIIASGGLHIPRVVPLKLIPYYLISLMKYGFEKGLHKTLDHGKNIGLIPKNDPFPLLKDSLESARCTAGYDTDQERIRRIYTNYINNNSKNSPDKIVNEGNLNEVVLLIVKPKVSKSKPKLIEENKDEIKGLSETLTEFGSLCVTDNIIKRIGLSDEVPSQSSSLETASNKENFAITPNLKKSFNYHFATSLPLFSKVVQNDSESILTSIMITENAF